MNIHFPICVWSLVLISSGSRNIYISTAALYTYMTLLGDLLGRFVLSRQNIWFLVRGEACWVSQDAVLWIPLSENQEARVGVANFWLEEIIFGFLSGASGNFRLSYQNIHSREFFVCFLRGISFIAQLSHFYSIFIRYTCKARTNPGNRNKKPFFAYKARLIAKGKSLGNRYFNFRHLNYRIHGKSQRRGIPKEEIIIDFQSLQSKHKIGASLCSFWILLLCLEYLHLITLHTILFRAP